MRWGAWVCLVCVISMVLLAPSIMHPPSGSCREAARRGGGDFVCPVQRVDDFLEGRASAVDTLPSSSYRCLGFDTMGGVLVFSVV